MSTDVIENGQHALSVPATMAPTVAAGPMGSAMQALQAGMSIEQMRGLLDLQKDWEANEARKDYVADMAEFKKNPPEIFKTKQVAFGQDERGNGGTAYMHATLGDVTSQIVAGLAKHGFSHRWDTEQRDGGQIYVTCTLTHKKGHSESTAMNSSADQSGKKNNIQALASTVSYLQRYTLLAASGLATKDMPMDDDGNAAGAGEGPSGIATYNAASNLEHWLAVAREAKTEEALTKTRADACHDFELAKDLAGWNEVRDEIKAIRTAMRSQVPA